MEEEQEEVEFYYHHHHYSSPEVCSKREAEDEEELELGLSLGAGKSGKGGGGGGGQWGEYCRILTAKDFPCIGGSRVSSNSSSASSSFSLGGRSGSKRGDESVAHEIGTNTPNQLVGWPPIRARRINNLFNQSKANEQEKTPITRKSTRNNAIQDNDLSPRAYEKKPRSQFVKINMDGVPIGRKVDLGVHRSYDTLALVLEDMFQDAHSFKIPLKSTKASKLLDGSSEFVLTYEDKDGDWMLVGDVPWRMFLRSVRRLRIMKTTDANGLDSNRRTID